MIKVFLFFITYILWVNGATEIPEGYHGFGIAKTDLSSIEEDINLFKSVDEKSGTNKLHENAIKFKKDHLDKISNFLSANKGQQTKERAEELKNIITAASRSVSDKDGKCLEWTCFTYVCGGHDYKENIVDNDGTKAVERLEELKKQCEKGNLVGPPINMNINWGRIGQNGFFCVAGCAGALIGKEAAKKVFNQILKKMSKKGGEIIMKKSAGKVASSFLSGPLGALLFAVSVVDIAYTGYNLYSEINQPTYAEITFDFSHSLPEPKNSRALKIKKSITPNQLNDVLRRCNNLVSSTYQRSTDNLVKHLSILRLSVEQYLLRCQLKENVVQEQLIALESKISENKSQIDLLRDTK